jgi:hypothetical protein
MEVRSIKRSEGAGYENDGDVFENAKIKIFRHADGYD